MKLNGKLINADYMDFRIFEGGTARLALDHKKGAYLIRYEYADLPLDDRFYMTTCPEELEIGKDGTGKAHFKQGWMDNPATGERTWNKPVIACRVEKMPYDAWEQACFDKQESNRAALRQMLEDERKRTEALVEEKRIDREAKLAMIEMKDAIKNNQSVTRKRKTTKEQMQARRENGLNRSAVGPEDKKEIIRLWRQVKTDNPDFNKSQLARAVIRRCKEKKITRKEGTLPTVRNIKAICDE